MSYALCPEYVRLFLEYYLIAMIWQPGVWGCALNDVCSSKGDNEFVWVDTMLTDEFRRGSILQAENIIDLNVPWER